MRSLFKKQKKKHNPSVYLSFDEFKKLAAARNIDKNDQFLQHYYNRLHVQHKEGIKEKDAATALNDIVINEADYRARQSSRAASVDMTSDDTLKRFLVYVSSPKHIQMVLRQVLSAHGLRN